MKYIRLLLSIIIFLAGLAAGALAGLFFTQEKTSQLILPDGTSVPFEYFFGLICLVLLVIGYIVFPSFRSKGRPRSRKPSKAEIQARLKEHQDKATVAAGPQDLGSSVPEEDYDQLLSGLSDDDPMNRLVALGQTEMTLTKLDGLIKEFYPDLAKIKLHFNPEHTSTIDTFSRHILGIARFKIKITDQSLNNDQFATFQQRIFDDEEKTILRMYKPEDSAAAEQNKEYVGTLVDDRDWEILQRKLRASRNDWVSFSLAEAKNLLG